MKKKYLRKAYLLNKKKNRFYEMTDDGTWIRVLWGTPGKESSYGVSRWRPHEWTKIYEKKIRLGYRSMEDKDFSKWGITFDDAFKLLRQKEKKDHEWRYKAGFWSNFKLGYKTTKELFIYLLKNDKEFVKEFKRMKK